MYTQLHKILGKACEHMTILTILPGKVQYTTSIHKTEPMVKNYREERRKIMMKKKSYEL